MSKGPPLFREKSLADGLVFLRHPNTIVGVAGPLLVRPAILNIPSSVACAGYNNVLGQPTFKMQLEHHALGGGNTSVSYSHNNWGREEAKPPSQ